MSYGPLADDIEMETERERIFREIYEDNIGRLYQYVLRRIGDVNYTEDTLQEVAVALLFHLNDFLPGYPNNTKRIQKWLFGVAENKIKHFWRKHTGYLSRRSPQS